MNTLHLSPKLGITISDYLYLGEGSENCINNTKELLVWEISGDNIEDDVEITRGGWWRLWPASAWRPSLWASPNSIWGPGSTVNSRLD